jgi:DNA-binding transcriptional ArsR family regulator
MKMNRHKYIDENLIKQFEEKRKSIPNPKLSLRDFINLYNFAKKELEKKGIDIKQFDILSEIDMNLDYWENRENVKKKFSERYGIAFDEDIKNNIEKWQEQQINFIEEITKEEEEEIKNRIISGADNDIIKHFEDIEKMIKVLVNSNEKKGLIILGAKGLGKTYSTIYFLKKLGIKHEMVRGHISPIALFNVISRNNENVILFDDCLTLFKDDKKVGFILNALDEIGIVDYRTYNMASGEITNKFVFKGKMIFIFNEFNEKNVILKALRDRCFTLSLNFKRKEILEMLYTLAKKDGLIFLVDWLKDRKIELSLRDYLTLKAIYKVAGDNWQSLAEKVIDNEIDRETNEIDKIILKINEENPDKSNNEKARIFNDITGMGRMTYYRHLKKLRELGLL